MPQVQPNDLFTAVCLIVGAISLLLLIFYMLAKLINVVITYLKDWSDIRNSSAPIMSRMDLKGGTYFWYTNEETKLALDDIVKQIKEHYPAHMPKKVHLNGIYVIDRALARAIHDALTHAGYPVGIKCRLLGEGPEVIIIDT